MRIEFTFSRDRAYFRQQLKPTAVASTQLAAALGVVVAFAGFVLFIGIWLVPGIAIGVAGLLIIVGALTRRHRMVTVPASFSSPRRWLLTDDGLESETDQTSASYAWSTFQGAGVTPNAYLLITGGERAVIDVPRQPLSAEQDAELRAFLVARELLRGPIPSKAI